MSHSPWNCAEGIPHEDGLGEPAVMSPGIDERGKNQMEIEAFVNSVAYTPPFASLSPAP